MLQQCFGKWLFIEAVNSNSYELLMRDDLKYLFKKNKLFGWIGTTIVLCIGIYNNRKSMDENFQKLYVNNSFQIYAEA